MALTIKTIELKKLKPYEKNTRIHTEEQTRELAKSLEKFGQYRPLVVDIDGTIFVGNGLFEALKKIGAKTCEVVELPKETTESDKKKLMLADNKLYSLGLDNLENINALLEELEDFKVPGFDEEVLESLFNGLAKDKEIDHILKQEREEKKKQEEEIRESTEEEEEEEEESEDYEEDNGRECIDEEEEKEEEVEREEDREKTKTRTLVVCPNCGEEIWL